ncbi:MAG TPA: hypothetical protein VHZ31_09085 [Solirubrobacteraceae bacterium]|nr:hypothetical protein [Solirubrobacteraceae bacterium]
MEPEPREPAQPAEPRIRVRGGSGPLQTRVELACLRALRELRYATSLQVSIKRDPLKQEGAGASLDAGGGMWVNLGLAKHGEPLLGWVLSEEIAHHYLADVHGIRRGGDFVEELLHELFATWFQIRESILAGRMSFADLITAPVPVGPPSPELGEHLGKQIAGAVCGSEANAAHLETWFADPRVDELQTQFARVLLDRAAVPYDDAPPAVAAALREIYDEILAAG